MNRLSSAVLVASAAIVLRLGGAASAADSFTLASDAFLEGKPIPPAHGCDGADQSPPLHWDGAPAGTAAFALIVDDPDAPNGNWNHWVLFNVPAGAKALAASVPKTPTLGDGSRQGTNDFGRIGYGGPCPPPRSSHRYQFKLFALSAPLDLQPGAKRDAVLKEIESKKLGSTVLTGRFERQ
jgi:Raf kinase inhibitor-like YbhB/YbcL family protein